MNKGKGTLVGFIAFSASIIGFLVTVSKLTKRKTEINIDPENDGQIDFQVSFGGGARYINSEAFEKAYLTCKFGGMEVYFDKAKLHEGSGVVDVDCSFGGVELYVPKDWTVVNNVKALMGAVEYMEKGQDLEENPDKMLYLEGQVACGAVEIYYV